MSFAGLRVQGGFLHYELDCPSGVYVKRPEIQEIFSFRPDPKRGPINLVHVYIRGAGPRRSAPVDVILGCC